MALDRLSAFRQLQRQARAALTVLRIEIRSREAELQRLKREERQLRAVAVGNGRQISSTRKAKRVTRLNWRSVLVKLPKQFKAADLRKISALRSKRPSELFNGITRWIQAGLVKRKAVGLYERLEQSRRRKSKRAA